MRVLLDANILISYLLNPQRRTGSIIIVEAALAEDFTLVLPDNVLEEVTRKVLTAKHLTAKIHPTSLTALLTAVREVATIPPPLRSDEIGLYSRDVKDDYLVAYALAAHVDYLVSGDKDLLTLGRVGTVEIISTGAFLAILQQAG